MLAHNLFNNFYPLYCLMILKICVNIEHRDRANSIQDCSYICKNAIQDTKFRRAFRPVSTGYRPLIFIVRVSFEGKLNGPKQCWFVWIISIVLLYVNKRRFVYQLLQLITYYYIGIATGKINKFIWSTFV